MRKTGLAEVSFFPMEQMGRISFHGEITGETMHELVRQVENAFAYYRYEAVEIEIDSPGGEEAALAYFLEHRESWRRRKLSLRTKGLVTCASAAALLLVLGDHGGRSIHQATRLVLHYSRTPIQHTLLTARAAQGIAAGLNHIDTSVLRALVRHVTFQHHGSSEAGMERFIRTGRERLEWLVSAADRQTGAASQEVRTERGKLMSVLSRILGRSASPEVVEKRLRRHLHRRLAADWPIDPHEAYVLNLVDHIVGVTPTAGFPLE